MRLSEMRSTIEAKYKPIWVKKAGTENQWQYQPREPLTDPFVEVIVEDEETGHITRGWRAHLG